MNIEDLRFSKYYFPHPLPQVPAINPLSHIVAPDSWMVNDNGVWCYFEPKETTLQKYGWKIHISISLADYEQSMRKLLPNLIALGVPFKCAASRHAYQRMLDKNADRRQAGKCITIYPKDQQLTECVEFLGNLNAFVPGPDILTDYPSKVPGVSLRYGAFTKYLTKEGKFGFLTADGTESTDEREIIDPYAQPAEAYDSVKDLVEKPSEFSLDVTPIRAIKQCAAGGVYEVKYKGHVRILKQGRAKTGYDETGLDGASRVDHEARMLEKINRINIPTVPTMFASFTLNKDKIMVIGKATGVSLHQWKIENYPLYSDPEAVRSYLRTITSIVNKIVTVVSNLHDVGISHNDIHTRNILYDPTQESITLIDFESAYDESENDFPKSLPKAAGYYRKTLTVGKPGDWYAVSQVLQELLFANIVHLDLSQDAIHSGWSSGYYSFKTTAPREWGELWKLFRSLRHQTDATNLRKRVPASRTSVFFPNTKRTLHAINSSGYRDSVSPTYWRADLSGLFFGGASEWHKTLQDYRSSAYETASKKTHPLCGEINEQGRPSLVRTPNYLLENPGILRSTRCAQLFSDAFLGPTDIFSFSKKVEDLIFDISNIKDHEKLAVTKKLNLRFESPRDFSTGLFFGPLALAYPISRALAWGIISDADTDTALDALNFLIEQELASYETDKYGGLQARVGSRLLPYLATGSAAFGLVLSGLKVYRERLLPDATTLKLLKSASPSTSNSVGLFNGYSGLLLGQKGICNYLEIPFDADKAIDHLISFAVKYDTFEGGSISGTPSDGGYRITTDFASGCLGVDFAYWVLTKGNVGNIEFQKFEEWLYQ